MLISVWYIPNKWNCWVTGFFLYLTLADTANFPESGYQVTLPPRVYEFQVAGHSYQNMVLSVLLILAHLGEVVLCNLYSLIVNEVEHIFIYLLAIWI